MAVYAHVKLQICVLMQGGAMVLLVGHRTCDLQAASSGWGPSHSGLVQAAYPLRLHVFDKKAFFKHSMNLSLMKMFVFPTLSNSHSNFVTSLVIRTKCTSKYVS